MREIAELIGRDASTIFRELRRNAPPIYQGYYLSHKAQERADARNAVSASSESERGYRI